MDTLKRYSFFPTPSWCTVQMIQHVAPWAPAGVWLEPAVGSGAIVDVVKEFRPDVEWFTYDIREDSVADCTMDYAHERPGGRYVFGVTNPPFPQATDFVENMLATCEHVVILQRLNWLRPVEERSQLLRDMPPEVFVMADRPSFSSNGKSDMQEYAWFGWGEGFTPGRYQTLPKMPKQERNGWQEYFGF